VRTAMFINVFT